MSIGTKINEVMKLVGYLQKDMDMNMGGSFRYTYLSEAKITNAIRDACVKVGLCMYPSKIEVIENIEAPARNGTEQRIILRNTYCIMDSETGEKIEVVALGEGRDNYDKATNKAMTGAFKYAERQGFMIPTGDDPDKDSGEEEKPHEGIEEIRAKINPELKKFFKEAGVKVPEVVEIWNKHSGDQLKIMVDAKERYKPKKQAAGTTIEKPDDKTIDSEDKNATAGQKSIEGAKFHSIGYSSLKFIGMLAGVREQGAEFHPCFLFADGNYSHDVQNQPALYSLDACEKWFKQNKENWSKN